MVSKVEGPLTNGLSMNGTISLDLQTLWTGNPVP